MEGVKVVCHIVTSLTDVWIEMVVTAPHGTEKVGHIPYGCVD